jgi:hypothetical protein
MATNLFELLFLIYLAYKTSLQLASLRLFSQVPNHAPLLCTVHRTTCTGTWESC